MRGPSVVVMGVSGTGKTTVAEALARRTGRLYLEGDDFHPASNKERMGAGIALTDADRAPWLAALADRMTLAYREGTAVALSCSALRRAYRDVLRGAQGGCLFVHLTGEARELRRRMAERAARTDHYMPTSLLDSQLHVLEPLDADEAGVAIDTGGGPEATIEAVVRAVDGLHRLSRSTVR